MVKKTLLDQGKKDEDEKDSLKEVASILAAMSASSKSDANVGGKAASDNDLAMAAAVKKNKIIKKSKPWGAIKPHRTGHRSMGELHPRINTHYDV